jgi:hypothetical protein
MDAPLYPPARAFEAPVRLPRILNTSDAAVYDLKAVPAAWAIVLKELPGIESRFVGQLEPHLSALSFRSLVQFGMVKADALDRIDAQLRALGEVR